MRSLGGLIPQDTGGTSQTAGSADTKKSRPQPLRRGIALPAVLLVPESNLAVAGSYGNGGIVLNTPHGVVTPAPLMLAGPLIPGILGI